MRAYARTRAVRPILARLIANANRHLSQIRPSQKLPFPESSPPDICPTGLPAPRPQAYAGTRAHVRSQMHVLANKPCNSNSGAEELKKMSSVALNIDQVHISFHSAQMTGAEYEDKSNL